MRHLKKTMPKDQTNSETTRGRSSTRTTRRNPKKSQDNLKSKDTIHEGSLSTSSTEDDTPRSLSPSPSTLIYGDDIKRVLRCESAFAETSSIATTDSTGPRSLSPSVRTSSIATTDSTGPRSLSPSVRTSMYGANLVKAYDKCLLTALSPDANRFDEHSCHEAATVSMRYTDVDKKLSGYYFGTINTETRLPDGHGVLCCRDGRLINGEWRMGSLVENHCARDLSLLGDSSTCSSLSASVTHSAIKTNPSQIFVAKIPKDIFVTPCTSIKSDHVDDTYTMLHKQSRLTPKGICSGLISKTSSMSECDEFIFGASNLPSSNAGRTSSKGVSAKQPETSSRKTRLASQGTKKTVKISRSPLVRVITGHIKSDHHGEICTVLHQRSRSTPKGSMSECHTFIAGAATPSSSVGRIRKPHQDTKQTTKISWSPFVRVNTGELALGKGF